MASSWRRRCSPGVALITPMFQLFGDLHWIGSYQALIIPEHLASCCRHRLYAHLVLERCAVELEAARIDGATRAQAFRLIVLPLAAPALFTTAILAFIATWNEFMLCQPALDAGYRTGHGRHRTLPGRLVHQPYTAIMAHHRHGAAGDRC